jgi:formylglycine-generating enzyme required for sulfatase activity
VTAAVVCGVMVWYGVQQLEPELKFVVIPGGCFAMGSPNSETGRDSDEGPVHRVCLKQFELARAEITQRQWSRVMVYDPNPSHQHTIGCRWNP